MEKDDIDSVIGRLKVCLKAMGKAYGQDEQLKADMANLVGFKSRTFDAWKKPTKNYSHQNLLKLRDFMMQKEVPPIWMDWVIFKGSDWLPSLVKEIGLNSAQSE